MYEAIYCSLHQINPFSISLGRSGDKMSDDTKNIEINAAPLAGGIWIFNSVSVPWLPGLRGLNIEISVTALVEMTWRDLLTDIAF